LRKSLNFLYFFRETGESPQLFYFNNRTPALSSRNVNCYASAQFRNYYTTRLKGGCSGERTIKRNAYRLLVRRPEGKRPLGRPTRRWVDNIRMDLGEVGWGDVVFGDWSD
jgi:hypothetical protein